MGKEIRISFLKKSLPKLKEEIFAEMEVLLQFLNFSPLVQESWLRLLKVPPNSIKRIMLICDHYAKLKIKEENKRIPKSRKEVIRIENECFRKIYSANLIYIQSRSKRYRRIAKGLLKERFPNSVIFENQMLKKFIQSFGTRYKKEWERFPNFLVFDPKEKKIRSFEVLWIPLA
jgi:hypothetical protein